MGSNESLHLTGRLPVFSNSKSEPVGSRYAVTIDSSEHRRRRPGGGTPSEKRGAGLVPRGGGLPVRLSGAAAPRRAASFA